MTDSCAFNRVAIIGLGLIGGSMSRALKNSGAIGQVIGCVKDIDQAELAQELDLADEVVIEPAQAVRNADIVIVAVGIQSMAAIFKKIAPALKQGAIVSDVGSTKKHVIQLARAYLASQQMRYFVAGHPIAGTEFSGLQAGFAELFVQRQTILTPEPDTRHQAIDTIKQLWQLMGASCCTMTADHHDNILAATSHLPHFLSFCLVDLLASKKDNQEIFAHSAGGFADFTRIAGSDPELWTHIMSANHQAITRLLDQYIEQLSLLRTALCADDKDTIRTHFKRASDTRRRLSQKT